ncbi:MAG TPA: hypothetical protein VF316_22720 [Polyangiaceae bacterium]
MEAVASTTEEERSLRGETRFVRADEFAACSNALRARGALVVNVALYGCTRGSLASTCDQAIEDALHARGASGPGIGSEGEACAMLSDQLFRARRLGFRGIALLLPTLRPLAAPVGALDAVDAHALCFLREATEDRPVVLAMNEADRELGVLVGTLALERVLWAVPVETASESRVVVASVVEEVEIVHAPPTLAASLRDAGSELWPPKADSKRRRSELGAYDHDGDLAPEPEPEPVAVPEPVLAAPEPPAPDPSQGAWRAWTQALAAARGPQPLSSFERLFAQSYLPLATAIDAGLDEPKAFAARDEFSRTFARAYSEACPTFALTGKRPRMVFDAHDVAAKMARTHGARSTHLLLVDAMRYDVAARVLTLVTAQLVGRATLVDRVTLFAALPTCTGRQLDALARGAVALTGSVDDDREADPIRDRTAEIVRRVRVGSRDVHKLDLVEARLRSTTHALAELPAVEQECANAIVKHTRTLPSRTLLLVFGDHGFRIQDDGTVSQGGATPEEVMVSAYGLLLGELH